MTENKKTSKEAKRKVPFNVFRKGAMALAVAGVMVATPFMLTGCAGEKGETGPAGATWFSGTQHTAEQGKVGDFFYDTDDCNIYQKTNSGWTLLSNIKGENGKSAYEIAKEGGFEGTEAEWLASLKGDKGNTGATGQQGPTGVGITDVQITYEYDEVTGQLYSVFTITYSEGEPQVIKTAVPKKLTQINGISLGGNNSTISKFAKVENANETPTLYVNVSFDDGTNGNILLTENMLTDNQQIGLSIPNFTQVGTYNYEIKYMGKTGGGQLEIVDMANYISTVTHVYLVNTAVTTNSKLSDLIVNINYENGESVYAPLSTVAESYYSYKTEQTTSELDLSLVSSYKIELKSGFAFKYDPSDEEYVTLYLSVYDENCTISYINVDEVELELGDADFEEQLKATTFEGYLHKEKDGQYNIQGTVEDLTYDLSNFDINRVGIQYIPFTYQLEGETGHYSNYIEVSVVADLDGVEEVGTFTVDAEDPNMMMFMMAQGDSITLYENGIAEISNAMSDGQVMQVNYDTTLAESGVFKMYDGFMNAYSYFMLDDETNTISLYSVAEIAPTDYTCKIEMMDEMFDSTISIYGTEGTCKTKVSILMPKEATGAPTDMLMPYAFVDCTWVDEDTLTFAGRTFNIVTGNVLEEVTE